MWATRKRLIVSLAVLGTFLIAGTAVAYQSIVARWGSDPRGTLIAAATVGISFFISMNLLLAWDERRRERLARKAEGERAAKPDDT